MEVIEQLTMYGLTRQEATLYVTLLSEGELTGYEAAKKTTISRSNTYNGLAGLVDKGAAYIIEGSVTKYTPVSIEEFCNNKLRNLEDSKQRLMELLPIKKVENSGYITIQGEKNVMDKLRTMLVEAQERVYLSVSGELLEKVKDELLQVIERNIKLVIITDQTNLKEQAIVYITKKKDHRIRLIVDSGKVLTGEITTPGDTTCLYSMNDNLVSVFKEMLQNEIILLQQNIQQEI
ncbi:TrmB family transcriptional regulator [Anaerosporobacter faecicola]|uniref:TrmB family transcriptional regulator n=1 Tax=Anaerosporobacter faecicola TaxID=2718714 RepID=UPI001439A379|nr:TrmB family transcriptional regulator [Anaerosporobacter faecicola]